ncbi:unnamed protein product, partial [Arabidopsis halleri]
MTWQPGTGCEVRPFSIIIYDAEKLPKCPSQQVKFFVIFSSFTL